jgi:hypothetical protein
MTGWNVNVKRLPSCIRVPSARQREPYGSLQLCLMYLRAMSVATGALSGLLGHWKLKERLSATCLCRTNCNLHTLPTVSGAPLRLAAKFPLVIIPIDDK